jgi:hypothetical protein
MLNDLYDRLTEVERRFREEAFIEAHDYVDVAAAAGGVGFIKKSFPRKPRRDHRRIDIEVQKGLAFVPDSASG